MKKHRAIWTDDQATAIILAGVGLFFFGEIALLIVLFRNDASTLDSANSSGDAIYLLISALLSLAAFGGSVYFLGIRRHLLGWRAVSFHRTSLTWLAVSFLIGLFFVPVSITISRVVRAVFFKEGDLLYRPPVLFESVPMGEFLIALVSLAVIVPIAEEMFFRGMLFRWIRTRTNLTVGLFVSSIIFGAVHLSAPSMLSLSIVGGFCALMLEYSGSLWNSIAIHSANNGIIVIVSYFVFKTSVMV